MVKKNKTDTASALEQYNSFDASTQYLLSSFLQLTAAIILNIKQIKPIAQAQNAQHSEESE